MKNILITILLLICPTLVFAQSCNGTSYQVVTGIGYYTNPQGQIFAYASLTPPTTICVPSGIVYTEVTDPSLLPSKYIPPQTNAQLANQLADSRIKALSGINWDSMVQLEINGINWTGIQALTNNSIAWTTNIIPAMNVTCSVNENTVNWSNWSNCESKGISGSSALNANGVNWSSGMTAFLCGNGAITGKC